MAIMIHITYTGEGNNAHLFAQEMMESGIVDKIKENPGNLQYDYFQPFNDRSSILLIDCWSNQDALDIHHQSPLMGEILKLRLKYNLTMDVKRYSIESDSIPEYDRSFIHAK